MINWLKEIRKPKLLRLSSALLIRTYCLIFLKLRINQKHILPKGPKIFSMNHPTTIDPIIIYSIFPNAKMLINSEIFNMKPWGKAFTKLGHISVDYNDGGTAYRQAINSLKDGYDLIIFPEGGESHQPYKIRDFKTGTIRLALTAKVPIIPIGVEIDDKKIKKFKIRSPQEGTDIIKLYLFGKYSINIGKSIKLKGDVKNREYVKRKSRYLKEEIQKLSRK